MPTAMSSSEPVPKPDSAKSSKAGGLGKKKKKKGRYLRSKKSMKLEMKLDMVWTQVTIAKSLGSTFSHSHVAQLLNQGSTSKIWVQFHRAAKAQNYHVACITCDWYLAHLCSVFKATLSAYSAL